MAYCLDPSIVRLAALVHFSYENTGFCAVASILLTSTPEVCVAQEGTPFPCLAAKESDFFLKKIALFRVCFLIGVFLIGALDCSFPEP